MVESRMDEYIFGNLLGLTRNSSVCHCNTQEVYVELWLENTACILVSQLLAPSIV
jgi:hypothetical protein